MTTSGIHPGFVSWRTAVCRQGGTVPAMATRSLPAPVSPSRRSRARPRRRPAAPGGRPHTTPVCDLPPGLPDRRLDRAATSAETVTRALGGKRPLPAHVAVYAFVIVPFLALLAAIPVA